MLVATKKMEFSSTYQSVSQVESLIESLCETHRVPPDSFGNILIAVTEAINNAIQHGNKLDPEKKISLEFMGEEQRMVFAIEDQGDGFDYDNVPDPTEPENLEKPHGRGIFLMRNLADEVAFEKQGRLVRLGFVTNLPA
jgi:serine/threonine-protein kinase RsbW